MSFEQDANAAPLYNHTYYNYAGQYLAPYEPESVELIS